MGIERLSILGQDRGIAFAGRHRQGDIGHDSRRQVVEQNGAIGQPRGIIG